MTREQAINYLRSSGMSEEQINGVVEGLTCEDAVSREAVREGMTKSETWNNIKQGKCIPYKHETLAKIREVLEQEPCEDAVSRKAVLEVVNNPLNIKLDKIIEKLPSVTPKQRTGKWEKAITLSRYRCSVCKGEHNDSEKGKWYEIFDTCAYNFCPNCGAKMEGDNE